MTKPKKTTIEVKGCASCPFDDRDYARCRLAGFHGRLLDVTADDGPPPPECPLRTGPVEVRL